MTTDGEILAEWRGERGFHGESVRDLASLMDRARTAQREADAQIVEAQWGQPLLKASTVGPRFDWIAKQLAAGAIRAGAK